MWLLISILVLSFLIFFHELGHFLIARLFGVRVEVFSIGFGKKLIKKTIGNTEYAISAIPLGGYVKMKGQDDLNPTLQNRDDDSFNTKAPWKKICILFAGSGANIMLAFLLYIVIGVLGINSLLPVIGETMQDSPAMSAGFTKDDKILKIDDKDIKIWRDISDYVSNKNKPLLITFERNREILQVTLTPKIKDSKNIFGEDIKQSFIGIKAKGEIGKVTYKVSELIPFAFNETIYSGKMILLSIQKLIIGILPTSELGGPIAIVQIISQATDSGIIALFGITALISINLGVLNLFPIPALDGGHIIFCIYEWIVKKPLNENVLYRLTIFGWVLLLCLMALGIYNDISRIATKTP
ncbi:RIP metalloprotease RseP [Helicobacter sp. MIT 14-3879]|uniref:RIP metalloprotease RseP n=1 Tax=Helicobacter sp. MIT 14-3879 TaxID=2040649 RepID=UPI000E1F5C62|nr:RIP metalloprotease RseP [Helicobacter sp. MIT 14-3879]RDU65066.1 RIP metalloprotease RseP [Helicobacter sp. MIT 14-3879]